MCGIFGLVAASGFRESSVEEALADLFLLSESRGKEASGIAVATSGEIAVVKSRTPASELIKRSDYRALLKSSLAKTGGFAAIGHSRLVTNGDQTMHSNNQPVITSGVVGVHNGIIANVDDVWTQFSQLPRQFDVDSEVIFALTRHFRDSGLSVDGAVSRSFEPLEGVANIAAFLEESDDLVLATNNGSLYLATSDDGRLTVFASEEYILSKLKRGRPHLLGRRRLEVGTIDRVEPGTGRLIGLGDGRLRTFSLASGIQQPDSEAVSSRGQAKREITDLGNRNATAPGAPLSESPKSLTRRQRAVSNALLDEAERAAEATAKLVRCARCVLPTTYPFVDLDSDGVCIYCRNYQPFTFDGHEALAREAAPHRREDGRPDCLIALSGGRDSTNCLHYAKNELGLTPIAYTYDWGMITDLARRNASRICAELGVEHIIVSANIEQKRSFIRKNVEAWLRKPDIGTVPLFMAGDKQFFWYAEQLKRKTGIELLMFAMNPLERTDFKHGFCGISGGGHDGLFFRLNWAKNLQIAAYYAKAYAQNRAYLNSSLFDTAFAYFAYFVMPHNYTMFHDYIGWVEEDVEAVLDLYKWERSPDTSSTWRIGDGTAPFYNYIYWMVTGFSENDTFRSEQIRAGTLTREQALARIATENLPRWQSIQWYCETVGLDFERTIATINSIGRLY